MRRNEALDGTAFTTDFRRRRNIAAIVGERRWKSITKNGTTLTSG